MKQRLLFSFILMLGSSSKISSAAEITAASNTFTWDQLLFKFVSFLYQPRFNSCQQSADCLAQEYCSEHNICLPKNNEMFLKRTPIIAQRAIYSLTFALATFYDNPISDFLGNICNSDKYYTALTYITPTNQRFDLYRGNDFDILAFRGTATTEDMIADAKIFLSKCTVTKSIGCGLVHHGFQEVFQQMAHVISQHFERPLLITGHSLGGALATLASMYIADKYGPEWIVGVYTSGAPEVGNRAFVSAYQSLVVRNVEVRRLVSTRVAGKKVNFDPVTLLPGLGVYDHVVPSIPTMCLLDDGGSCSDRDLHSMSGYVNSFRAYLNGQNSTAEAQMEQDLNMLGLFSSVVIPGNNTLAYEEEDVPQSYTKKQCADWF